MFTAAMLVPSSFQSNFVPEITTPVLNTSWLFHGQNISANATYTDYESDLGTVIFRWYVNNTNVFNETFNDIANGTVVNATLASSNYTKHNIINVSVQAFDGFTYTAINWSLTAYV
ncbi:hypothetical protein ACFL96_17270, partial [Thermoproteota archaeon]